MAREREGPPTDTDESRWIVILLVDLVTQSASRLGVSRNYQNRPIRDFLLEFAPSARGHNIDCGSIFNLTRRLALRPEQPLNESSIADGEVLLFSLELDLSTTELEATPTERILTFGEAREHIRHFRHRSYIPQWVQCRVTDDQYRQLLNESLLELPQYEQFPDRRLIAEINRSMDENMRQNPSRPRLLALAEAIIGSSDSLSQCEARRFLDQCGGAEEGRYGTFNDGSQVRFIGNTAALHLEPTPDIGENIVSLAEQGVILIGIIEVYSGFAATEQDPSQLDGGF